MSKDPAFLFYSSDFLTGTMFMTDEQVGKYIRLLCAQHQNGKMTENQVVSICKTKDPEVLSKFSCKDGLYFNERLEDVIEKRRNFTESRRKNGSKGGRPKASAKPSAKPSANLPENENENENIDTNKSGAGQKKPHSFQNSPYFEVSAFKEKFAEWSSEKRKHYYHSALDYSDSKGKKYLDWSAAIRSWDRNHPFVGVSGGVI